MQSEQFHARPAVRAGVVSRLNKPASMQSKQVNKKISKHASVKCEPSTPQGAALIMVSRMRRSRHHAGSGGGVNTNAALCEVMTPDSQSLGSLRCPRRSTQGTVPTVLYMYSLVVIPPTLEIFENVTVCVLFCNYFVLVRLF